MAFNYGHSLGFFDSSRFYPLACVIKLNYGVLDGILRLKHPAVCFPAMEITKHRDEGAGEPAGRHWFDDAIPTRTRETRYSGAPDDRFRRRLLGSGPAFPGDEVRGRRTSTGAAAPWTRILPRA